MSTRLCKNIGNFLSIHLIIKILNLIHNTLGVNPSENMLHRFLQELQYELHGSVKRVNIGACPRFPVEPIFKLWTRSPRWYQQNQKSITDIATPLATHQQPNGTFPRAVPLPKLQRCPCEPQNSPLSCSNQPQQPTNPNIRWVDCCSGRAVKQRVRRF